ncbi:MAG: formylglycine-generating enzyme family protein [Bacteroidota bacterium]
MPNRSAKTLYIVIIGFLFLSGCSIVDKIFAPQRPPLSMTEVPGGTYRMGDIFDWGNDDAQPVHEVTLPAYRIGTYEVTYAQYDAFAQNHELPLPPDDGHGRENRAVVYVSWDQAQQFCEWYGYRLPTEQEWEYAARSAGQAVNFPGTNHKDSLRHYARMNNHSSPWSYKVGTKEPNALGLYDMAGNVYEWIGAYYPIYERYLDNGEWYDLENRGMRVIRGGSFQSGASPMYTFWRVATIQEEQVDDLGFRCVEEL